ncbi:glycosyltransferase family 2 protein [Rhodovulum sp. DZ06]|uniref:glycosyltransferase family 2 protein n=1 Tax=Rhodovulum sp. DZ06 TaxID=3425126 RepID=UPI003D335FB6
MPDGAPMPSAGPAPEPAAAATQAAGPALSLIVTCWNVGPYIAGALQSALDAGLDGPEIIVVDDGSSDETAAVVDLVVARNRDRARWKLLRLAGNTPGGVGAAANLGLDEATGRAVAFLDGDDWLDPDALHLALARLAATGADMVFTDCVDFIAPEGRLAPYPDAALWPELEKAPDIEALRRVLLRCAPMPWRKVYARAFIDRIDLRFPVGDFYFEDNVHHWDAVLGAEKIALLNRPLHMHRVGSAAQTIGGRGRKFLAIFGHHDRIAASLDRRGMSALHAPEFAEWLVRHLWWALERIDPGGLFAFWEAARPCLLRHDAAALDDALLRAGLPPRGAALVSAVLAGDRTAFAAMYMQAMLPR